MKNKRTGARDVSEGRKSLGQKPIRGQPPDERRAVRPREAKPQLDPPRRWLEATLSKLSRNSEATVATYVKMYPPDAQGFRMRCSASFLECYALFGSLS